MYNNLFHTVVIAFNTVTNYFYHVLCLIPAHLRGPEPPVEHCRHHDSSLNQNQILLRLVKISCLTTRQCLPLTHIYIMHNTEQLALILDAGSR